MIGKILLGILLAMLRVVLVKFIFYGIILGIIQVIEFFNPKPYQVKQLQELLNRLINNKKFIDEFTRISGSASRLTPDMVDQLMEMKLVEEELKNQSSEYLLRRRIQKELRAFLLRIDFSAKEEPVAQAA